MSDSKLLIITSSGGGGLLQAAVAKEQEARLHHPNLQIVKRDLLKDWMWRGLDIFCISVWNRAQRKGDVRSQKFFISFQWVFDYISWPHVFVHTLRILFKENIDRVIDTQSLCTAAIIKAIRVFNCIKSKQVVLEKVMVDLPTKKATHFFRPIKWLSRRDKRHLHLKTIAPLLEEGQTAEEFWQKNCGLSDRDIHYGDVHVRQPFRRLQGKARSKETMSLLLQCKNGEELQWMRKTYERGNIHGDVFGHSVKFSIAPKDRVITILLGSQPASDATFNYVKNLIHLSQPSVSTHIFVFCADFEERASNLFCRISRLVSEMQNYPKHVSVIPFAFQSDEEIAALFHRSDITCSRSGGGTAMELIAVSTGEIWIHSEAKYKGKELSLKELLKGIPGWESESALYLQKMKGAKILTPETLGASFLSGKIV